MFASDHTSTYLPSASHMSLMHKPKNITGPTVQNSPKHVQTNVSRICWVPCRSALFFGRNGAFIDVLASHNPQLHMFAHCVPTQTNIQAQFSNLGWPEFQILSSSPQDTCNRTRAKSSHKCAVGAKLFSDKVFHACEAFVGTRSVLNHEARRFSV